MSLKRPAAGGESCKQDSFLCTGKSFYNTKNIKEQMFENGLQNEWNCDMLITEKNKHMFAILKAGNDETGGKLEEDVNTGRDVITRKIRDSGRCSQV